MKETHDPEKYRAMSVPFATADEGNAAMFAFFEDMQALREKHRIANVLVVVKFNVTYQAGEASAASKAFIGDVHEEEAIGAWALGEIQAERRERINRLASRVNR